MGEASERRPKMTREPERDPKKRGTAPAPTSDAVRALGYGSLGLTLLGVAMLARDVATETQRTSGWIPLVVGVVGSIAAAIARGASDAALASKGKAPLVESPPEGREKTLAILVFVLAVLVQAVVPMSYYLGEDRFDERFAWRMFSAVRVYDCNFAAYDTRAGREEPVPLMSTIHVAWITTLRRGREAVMERYLGWRCEQEGVSAARVVNRCTSPEGNQVPDVVRSIDCARGEVVRGPAETRESP
jgi:hypothetical protein